MFAPVTLKMIEEAQPRPDDVCEIDGDQINEVSGERKSARKWGIGFNLAVFTDRLIDLAHFILTYLATLIASVTGIKEMVIEPNVSTELRLKCRHGWKMTNLQRLNASSFDVAFLSRLESL